ncbi:hypothetical protein NX021_17005 [Cytobacillus firmus]|nr:hypothetical protein [Cytobacillus firmus]
MLYPGEIEAKIAEKNLKSGIILSEDVVNELKDMAKAKNVAISNSPFKIAPDDLESIPQI